MFVAYLFTFAYIIGSVWATYAILKGCLDADNDFMKGHNTK